MISRKPAIVIILALALHTGIAVPARAAVTLVSFTVTPSVGQVLIEWETASEIDIIGFFVNRSATETEGFSRISNFIPSVGDSIVGSTYSYTDQNVIDGSTYYYRLESIDLSNNSEFYDPVPATPGTPTNTPTLTPTSSPSPTPTSTTHPTITPTLTPTRTRTPFDTPLPTSTHTATPTHTPTVSDTTTGTATITPTTTSISMPTVEYTLEVVASETPMVVPSPTITTTPETDTGEPGGFLVDLIQSGNLPRVGLIVLVTAVWAVLVIGIYIYTNLHNQ